MPVDALSEEYVSNSFDIGNFLAQEREKDLFRFSTAGSVDDGKSTLIGRLLYDTQSVYDDQVRSIEGKGTTAPGQIDFALLTDGLRAEREQGITIDVAYRYFSTERRKFVIADTPGHEQYTRNMATGASTADASVVLIDARKGVLPQSLRHAYIASLLGVRHLLIAVNKMDLVAFDEAIFRSIEVEFRALLARIAADTGRPAHPIFVPVSALGGDNVVHRSAAMDWYDGPTLLELLEALPVAADTNDAPFRFPVQRVCRPDQRFRGFAGQIASGTIRVGDSISALPSGRTAQVSRIVTYDGDLTEAHAPLSVTLALSEELDISRGDLIVSIGTPAALSDSCEAAVVWMDDRPLECNRRYLLKHTAQIVPVTISAVKHRTDVGSIAQKPAESLALNDIGVAIVRFMRPIALDCYTENRTTGAFVLIDPQTNATVAAGMVSKTFGESVNRPNQSNEGPVTAEERTARWGHSGGILFLDGPAAAIDRIERSLFATGVVTVRAVQGHEAEWLAENGVLALVIAPSLAESLIARAGGDEITLAADDPGAAAAVHRLLVDEGVLALREGTVNQ
jgi:sulfate adenylyltransferase subunit 1